MESEETIAKQKKLGIWSLSEYQSSKIMDDDSSSTITKTNDDNLAYIIVSVLVIVVYLVKNKIIKIK